jgi:hypothetical protein
MLLNHLPPGPDALVAMFGTRKGSGLNVASFPEAH